MIPASWREFFRRARFKGFVLLSALLAQGASAAEKG